MKIALFCEAYAQQLTGAAAHVRVLARGLVKQGHQVLIISSDTEVDDCFQQGGVLYCPAKPSEGWDGQAARQNSLNSLRPALEKFAPELVHLHTFGALGQWGLGYAQKNGLPVYSTLHNLNDAENGWGSGMAINLHRAAARRSLLKCLEGSKAAASTSRRAKESLKAMGLRASILQVPPCVDTELFSPTLSPDAALLGRLGVLPGREIFLFAGALRAENAPGDLLEFWSKSVGPQDKLQLIIAGTGPEAGALAEQAKLLGIGGQVSLCGVLSRDELAACCAMARGYVSASRSAAMKAAPLEAAACGVPMLLRAGCANQDVLIEGKNGFTYENSEAFADFLKKLSSLGPDGRSHLKKLVARTAAGLTDTALAKAMEAFYKAKP